ncbi:MAG: hypothetical protein CMG17_01160 [Candidatus Marinimicrobia bacterium]|jgi:spermidine synthase|nr:hypothetical protein [Candidatus Neomarinimicrobiota bacterium]
MKSLKFKLLSIFFLSGFSSLIYQVVWQKALSQIIGVDHVSVTLIISLFMLGLGLGGAYGGKLTKTKFNLLSVYIWLEIILGVFGFFSVEALRYVNDSFAIYSHSYAVEYLVNFLILLLPTFLMGVSLPIIAHVFKEEYQAGELVGNVYSVNIIGAALGTLMSGFIFIGLFGLNFTASIAAFLNLILAFFVFTLNKENAPRNVEESSDLVERYPIPIKIYFCSLLIGFVALSYEIVLFRVFTSYFGATAYVFTLLIFSYLVMMALGNNFFGRLADTISLQSLSVFLSSSAIISTLLILWGQEIIYLLGLRQNYLVLWPFDTWILYAQILPVIFICMTLMLPVAFISGYFPSIVKTVNKETNHIGSSVGYVYAVQTLGNFSGALITGFILLPFFGTTGTLTFLGLMLFLVTFVVLFPHFGELFKSKKALLISLALISFLSFPSNFYTSVRLFSENNPEFSPQPTKIYESGFGATLGYEIDERMQVYVGRMFSNSFPTRNNILKSKDGCFPLDWLKNVSEVKINNALYIGLGSGLGPKCIRNLYPSSKIDIVEINPDLIQMAKEYGSKDLKFLLSENNIYINDGRRFLSKSEDKSYDLIQIGVFNAWCSGCGNLFTEDFFKIISSKLTSEGVATFNAYPAALKASLSIFDEVKIFSPGPERISDVFVSNVAIIDEKKLSLQSETIENKSFLDKGCIFNGKELTKKLANINSSLDDLPSTEYFINNSQFTYEIDFYSIKPPVDMRVFTCKED